MYTYNYIHYQLNLPPRVLKLLYFKNKQNNNKLVTINNNYTKLGLSTSPHLENFRGKMLKFYCN